MAQRNSSRRAPSWGNRTMNDESWETVSKKVFWDRDVPLERWRVGVASGHRSYLPDSISTMTPAVFIRFYGLDGFKRGWPAMRAALPAETLCYAGVYDLAWSQAVGGGWNLKPTADWDEMPERCRSFLTQVAKIPGQSIYEVAKNLGMQYRRAHDHAVWLTKTGKILQVAAVERGHRKIKLFPTCKASG